MSIRMNVRRGCVLLVSVVLVGALGACVSGGGGRVGVSYTTGFYQPWGFYGGGWGSRYWVGPPGRRFAGPVAGRPRGFRSIPSRPRSRRMRR
jgi:hypothetical protein